MAYDDDLYVTGNPRVRAGLQAGSLAWAFTTLEASNWQPLTWLSHALDCEIWALDPWGHHLTSLLLHAANTALLFLALRRLTGRSWPSALVAALFATHPLNVESVAWVAERKNVLCQLFWLLALWVYARYARAPSWGTYLGVTGCVALALASKPMAVTLPFTLLLLDAWPLGRLRRDASAWRLPLLEKLPWLGMAAAMSLVTMQAQAASGSLQSAESIPWAARVTNALVGYLAYVQKLFWPARLAVFYPHAAATLSHARIAFALAALLALSALAVALRRRAPYLGVGWLWYVGTLVPVIGLVQVGTQAMADRYAYVPLIGLFLAIAWGLADAAARLRNGARLATALALAWILALSLLTSRQIQVWRDSETLFASTVKAAPGAWVAHYNLGNEYADQGRHAEAEASLREAVRLAPGFARARNNLGKELDALGRSQEAEAAYREAIRLKPDLAEAHNNLGVDLGLAGRTEEAEASLREALRQDPRFVEARVNLAILLHQQGRLGEALSVLDEAVALAPRYAPARLQRGLVLLGTGRPDAARGELHVLQELDPGAAGSLASALGAAR